MARILIIDDDQHSVSILQRVLSRFNHDILHASKGLTGLQIAASEPIDLVLLELTLPDIGGHTVAALINRIPGNIPVVAVTNNVDSATQRRAMTYGCDGYITKPVDTRTFPDQIAHFLRRAGSAGGDGSAEDGAAENEDWQDNLSRRPHTII
ncbi:MAG: response regulator [Anaerolineae bacterium]|nr:response regulator [Anaerolineae bacterium]